jgi:hypothetical protein
MIYILAAIGTVTVARWIRERWQTRRDKGYPWLMPAVSRPERGDT